MWCNIGCQKFVLDWIEHGVHFPVEFKINRFFQK